jgi:hypothetical protein
MVRDGGGCHATNHQGPAELVLASVVAATIAHPLSVPTTGVSEDPWLSSLCVTYVVRHCVGPLVNRTLLISVDSAACVDGTTVGQSVETVILASWTAAAAAAFTATPAAWFTVS